jgi:hypothetical protein
MKAIDIRGYSGASVGMDKPQQGQFGPPTTEGTPVTTAPAVETPGDTHEDWTTDPLVLGAVIVGLLTWAGTSAVRNLRRTGGNG